MPSDAIRAASDRSVGPTDLISFVSLAILAAPGVVRLEPTLLDALRTAAGTTADTTRLHRTLGGRGAASVAGLQVSARSDEIDVRAEIAVDTSRPCSAVAIDVQRRVVDLLRQLGLRVGNVAVTILAVEERSSTGRR